jgi:hypothetical protein
VSPELSYRLLALDQTIGAAALFVVAMLTEGRTSYVCWAFMTLLTWSGWRLNLKGEAARIAAQRPPQ